MALSNLGRYIVGPLQYKRTAVSNAAYTILSTDCYIALTAITAAKTWTMPTAASVGAGGIVIVADESGAATSTFTVTLSRAGSDTLNGATTLVAINVAFGKATMISDGVSKWTRIV